MPEKLAMKVKGVPSVYQNIHDEEAWDVRYQTKIFPIESDNFINQLEAMGIEVKGYTQTSVNILLPHGWLHIQVSKEADAVYDNHGRQRIYVNRKEKYSRLLCRFDVDIELIKNDANDQFIGIISITDKGVSIWSQEFTNTDFIEEEIDTENEALLEYFMVQMNEIISDKHPEWRNPAMYWDQE